MKEPPLEERFESQKLDEGLRQRLEGLVPEVVRRMFYTGLGAVFTTEEGMRKLANEFSLPKDAARFLIQQAQGTKNELFKLVSAELRAFLENLNLNEELLRLLTKITFEIKTEIRLIPNEDSTVKPKVKNKVVLRSEESVSVAEEPTGVKTETTEVTEAVATASRTEEPEE